MRGEQVPHRYKARGEHGKVCRLIGPAVVESNPTVRHLVNTVREERRIHVSERHASCGQQAQDGEVVAVEKLITFSSFPNVYGHRIPWLH